MWVQVSRPIHADASRAEVLAGRLPQDSVVQRLVGHASPAPRVLLFQLLHAPGLFHLQARFTPGAIGRYVLPALHLPPFLNVDAGSLEASVFGTPTEHMLNGVWVVERATQAPLGGSTVVGLCILAKWAIRSLSPSGTGGSMGA